MAGVVPTKRSTSGRKQWSIHDGARSSLKRLRSELASDGCPESQVVLAKQLLEDRCEIQVEDQKENARLGVYWLIKASEQGNTEATDLLKKCLENGKGITEQNYLDVRACITMTQDEKIAKKAARRMFASLSNGEEYITTEQLQKKMLAIERENQCPSTSRGNIGSSGEPINGELVNNYDDFNSDSEEEVDWTQRVGLRNEKLTEEHLIAAAINYAHGQLPLVNRILSLSEPNLHALDHVPLIQRPVLHPVLALKILYLKLIEFIGRLSIGELFPLAKSEIQLLLIILVYSCLGTSESLIYFVPILLYFITFVIMMVTTFRMLHTKREFYEFRLWSGLFLTYSNGSLNADEVEFQYITNNLKPCWQFFISLLFNLMLYPIIAERYIPQSEMAVISFCLTFMTLLGFMYRRRSKIVYDFLILFSFAINVLAKYPYDTDPVVTQGWRFIDLKIPTFATYVIGNGIEFCINFRVLLYAFIPVLLLKIASRNKWKGIYMYCIPHCVTLSWLQIVVISSQGATMFGLLRGTLALVGFVLFLPLMGLTTIFLPALAVARWLVATNFIFTLGFFLILTITGFTYCKFISQTRFRKYTPIIQVIFSALSIYFLMNSILEHEFINNLSSERNAKPLNYETYQKFCHQQAWEHENVAATQIRCSQLDNYQIQWDGYFNDVSIKSVSNNLKYIVDKFPVFIAKQLYCIYGDNVQKRCDNSKHSKDDCEIFDEILKSRTECTLERYDTFTFEIKLRMHSGIWGGGEEIILDVADHFKNFTLALHPNDHLWFRGILRNDYVDGPLGSTRPHVKLEEVGCLACHDIRLTEVKLDSRQGNLEWRHVASALFSGMKSVLNFLFNPIVVFK